MTTIHDDVKTALAANATLAAAFTGGIKTRYELGAGGLTPTSYAPAFDATTKRLKPILIITGATWVRDFGVRDEGAGVQSGAQRIEVQFETDRANGFSVLTSGEALVHDLLHGKRIGSAKLLLREVRDNVRDMTNQQTCIIVAIYDAYNVKT
jgi:hypothetical protein